MSLRFQVGVNGTVKRCYNGVKIDFVKVNDKVLKSWETFIGPEVRKNKCRVDSRWSWKTILQRELRLAEILGQKPLAIAMVADDRANNCVIPIGLMLLAKKFRSISLGDTIFVWYISSAPSATLNQLFPSPPTPKGIGRILIETAIALSINSRKEGKILLHAAPPEPGCQDVLPRWYNSMGLKRLDRNFPISKSRRNDGRYFYADRNAALSISKYHDPLR